MTDLRMRRQKAIADMIRGDAVGSQEDVTERLAALGFAVTQATVSRDLDQIGAIKVKRGGVLSYVLPEQMANSDWAVTRLNRILSEWVQSVEAAGTLIIIRTPPGSAHLVSLAIDQAKLPEVAGTVSGDDTLFVAIRDGAPVGEMADRFRALSSQA
jgi:transcriptional regulator of arginine metabolism